MTANVQVRKKYSVVEKMDDCKSSIEKIIVTLKGHITSTTFIGNKHTTNEIITHK